MIEVEKIFASRLRNTIVESLKLGYYPSRFEKILNLSSGVAVAKKLVSSGDIQYGLKELVKLGRPDLAVESIMLEEKFLPLFSKFELDAAKWRLAQAVEAERV